MLRVENNWNKNQTFYLPIPSRDSDLVQLTKMNNWEWQTKIKFSRRPPAGSPSERDLPKQNVLETEEYVERRNDRNPGCACHLCCPSWRDVHYHSTIIIHVWQWIGLVHTCLYLSAPAAEGLLKLTAVGVTFLQRPEKFPVLHGSVCAWGGGGGGGDNNLFLNKKF
jgi:hypothetical protein